MSICIPLLPALLEAAQIVVDTDTTICATDDKTEIVVNSGTATLSQRADYGFKHYRFLVERPWGANARYVQFSELQLLDGDTDVTSRRSGYSAQCGAYDVTGRFPWNGTYTNPSGGSGYPEYYYYLFDGNLSTRVTDNYGATTATAENRAKVWVQVDFPMAQRVTSYNWARSSYWYDETRSDSPDPADWRFQGSDDGSSWIDLDVKRDFLTPYSSGRVAAWVGPFAIQYPQTTREVKSLALAEGTEARVVKDKLVVSRMSGGALSLVDGAALSLTDGDRVENTVIATGKIEKVGDGTATIEGDTSFAGKLDVKSGALLFRAGVCNHDEYYRFSFLRTHGRQQLLLGRIVLYDVNGVRVGDAKNYSVVRDVAAASLQPGQISCSSAYTFNQYEAPDALFYNDLTTDRKCFLNSIDGVKAYLDGANGLSCVFTVRLVAGTAPIRSYLFLSADGSNRWCAPDQWTVESSADGVSWRTVDSVSDYTTTTPSENWTLWNGGVSWQMKNMNDPANVAFSSVATIAVSSGAVLDLGGSAMTRIGGLAIDLASGAGSIDVLNPSPSGSLYLTGVGDWTGMLELPLAVGTVNDCQNLKRWTVFADGVAKPWQLSYQGGTLRLMRGGLVLVFR